LAVGGGGQVGCARAFGWERKWNIGMGT
jgi:hypothetical protein